MRIDHDNWLRAFSPSASSPVDGNAAERQQRQPNLLPGQQVKGEVLARLSDQVYLVRIAGQEYRTELALNLRPGDPLELTFRTGEPRPSFTLHDIAIQASPSRLSPTAALLSRVMSGAQGAITPRPAMPFVPLLDAHPADTAGMTTSLQRSLALSGLFYESHLVRWFLGERSLAELLREPQARLSANRGRVQGPEDGTPPLEGGVIPEPLPLADGSEPGGTMASGGMEELLGPGSAPFLPIVREQLAILLSGMVRCQVEVWPDQEMEWDVTRDGDGTEGGEEPCWRTTIRLRLPGLGAVDATLALSGTGIRGELKTDSPATMELMKQELETLENGMAGSGLRLREMVIECEPRG